MVVAVLLLLAGCSIDQQSDLTNVIEGTDAGPTIATTETTSDIAPASNDDDDASDLAALDRPEPDDAPDTTPSDGDQDDVDPSSGIASGDSENPAKVVLDDLPDLLVAEGEWADPFTPDQNILAGQLDNGMRYLIQQNDKPGRQMQLRLVVDAGSLAETEDQQGAAHFLEHMMFNGTEQYPGNEIVRLLESFGGAFGPDINATTSYERTVYQLQLPATAPDISTGLNVFRQWATAATLDPEAVINERGVVLAEQRRRAETAAGRLSEPIRAQLLDGTGLNERPPLGPVESIETMTAETLNDYYERWYRPDLMTVVAAGDFSPAEVERLISETFASLEASAPLDMPPSEIETGPFAEARADVLTDDEITSTSIELFWRRTDGALRVRNDIRAALLASLSMQLISTRLDEGVRGGDLPFIAASASATSLTPKLSVASIRAETREDEVELAMRAAIAEMERARQFAVTDDEFGRARAAFQAGFDQQLSQSPTRQDNDVAAALVDQAVSGSPAMSPADMHQQSTEALASLTAGDVRRYVHDLLETDPYVLVVGSSNDRDILPSDAALIETYRQVIGLPVVAPEQSTDLPNELMARPEAAPVVDRFFDEVTNATTVTFENGARLVVKPSQITENLVVLSGLSDGGFFAEEDERLVPLLPATAGIVSSSGFERLSAVDLQRFLSRSVVSLGTGIDRTSESITGSSSSDELELLLQLVHLQMTEPTIDEVLVEQLVERSRRTIENLQASPGLVATIELFDLRYGDSPYFRVSPTATDIDGYDPQEQLAAWQRRFADASDFVFVVTGDLDNIDQVVDLGARYLGTLPSLDGIEDVPERDPGLPEANLESTVRVGVGNQARLIMNWESPYELTPESEIVASALEIVVSARLRDLIREELGASYAPSAAVSLIDEPVEWVDTSIDIEVDPDRLDEVNVAIDAELDRLRAGDLEQSYLDNAIEALVDDFTFFSNNEWIDLLHLYADDPTRSSGEVRERRRIAQSLTLDDLAAAAQVVFPPQRSVVVKLLPAE